MSKTWAKIAAFGSAISLGVFGLASTAYMAVDADVASTTGSFMDTIKENVVGVLNTNIGKIAVLFVILFGIALIVRLTRRHVK